MRTAAWLAAAALVALALLGPAAALERPQEWPSFPPLPFPHLRDGNNTTNETDVTPPALSVQSPRDGQAVKQARLTVRGTASDENGVRTVEVSVNNDAWKVASGNTSWSLAIGLKQGRNSISVRAADLAGNIARQNLSVVLDDSVRDNTGVLLSAAVTIPIVALIVLFAMRRKAPPAGEPPEEHDDLEKRLGIDKKPRDESGEALEDPEEVSRLEGSASGKKGGRGGS
jgi:hypothetical protein